MNEYGYSINELDALLPWEKDIYLSLLIKRLQEKQEAAEKAMRV